MSLLASLLPTLIVFGVLILIHEFGHFMACRLTGVRVEKFSIGFGPEILTFERGGTRYAISLLPLGGFVKPAGESFSELENKPPVPGDYLAAPLLSRIFIVSAGVLMNYVLAFVLFAAVFMMGRPVPGTVVGGFVDGYPAKTSGLAIGDKITRIGAKSVDSWAALTDAINTTAQDEVLLTVHHRDGTDGVVSIRPKVETGQDLFGKPMTARRLGITPSPESQRYEKFGVKQSLKHGFESVYTLAAMTYKAIFYMATGRMSMKAMSGPIGIMAMTGSAAKLGLPYLLQLAATLSVSLAVINLLPIPALDGGHLLFLLIEGVIRRPLGRKAEERLTQAGFFALMALMVFVIYNDLINLSVFDKIRTLFTRGG